MTIGKLKKGAVIRLSSLGTFCTMSAVCMQPTAPPGGGGRALPINGLMGMCRWMGSHFHSGVEAESSIINHSCKIGRNHESSCLKLGNHE